MNDQRLQRVFTRVDREIETLEASAAADTEDVLAHATHCVRSLIDAYAACCGDPAPAAGDLLAALKVLVRADPSWNAIRDNCRELVYYRNCIQLDRRDALPEAYRRIAVRIARHVFLYMRARCEREGRLAS